MSLFSYLDGLVCTMGALILLLLMTAQRMKDQVLEQHVLEESRVAQVPIEPVLPDTLELPADPQIEPSVESAEPHSLPTPVALVPLLTEDQPEIENPKKLAKLEFEKQLAEREALISQLRRDHERAVNEHQSQVRADQKRWLEQVAELQSQSAELNRQVTETRSRIAVASNSAEQTFQEGAKLAELVRTVQTKSESSIQQRHQFQSEIDKLLNERESSLKTIDSSKLTQALRNPVFEIEAKESGNGTVRRPIIIECTSESLIFASEKISLSAETLDRYPAEFNPLMAGTNALIDYWTLQDAAAGNTKSQPYVLLVVRPGGTVAFYVARKYLEGLSQEFGYELVGAKTQFKWPEEDPEATKACQEAIDLILSGKRPPMLKHRPGSLGSTAPRGGTTSPTAAGAGNPTSGTQIVGSDGAFSLDEVEEMKTHRPSYSLGMLGPEWRNPNRNGAAGSKRTTQNGPSGPSQSAVANSGSTNRNSQTTPQTGNQGTSRLEPSIDMNSVDHAPNPLVDQRSDLLPLPAPQVATTAERSTSQNGRPEPTRVNPLIQSTQNRAANGAAPSTPPEVSRLPPPPLKATIEPGSTSWNPDGGSQRQWGKVRSSGSIGFEREMEIHLYPDRLAIQGGVVIDLTGDFTRQNFQEAVAMIIDDHVRGWGEPPSNFVYRPSFDIKIHPEGGKHYLMLKQLLEHWGLKYRIENVSQ